MGRALRAAMRDPVTPASFRLIPIRRRTIHPGVPTRRAPARLGAAGVRERAGAGSALSPQSAQVGALIANACANSPFQLCVSTPHSLRATVVILMRRCAGDRPGHELSRPLHRVGRQRVDDDHLRCVDGVLRRRPARGSSRGMAARLAWTPDGELRTRTAACGRVAAHAAPAAARTRALQAGAAWPARARCARARGCCCGSG